MNRLPNSLLRLFIALAVTFLFCMSAWSKTLYVEKWGDNGNSCTKSSPCLTITHAKNNSKRNGKIIVGPGVYVENVFISTNLLTEPLEGLKLQSSHGRHATFIQAANTGFSTVTISQPRVQIGKRKKGFTLMGSTSESGVEVSVNVGGVKIEGNTAKDNNHGFNIQGEKVQVRHNIAKDNTVYGVRCFFSSRGLIKGNTLFGNGTGMIVAFSNAVTVEDNYAFDNDGTGISTDTTSNTIALRIRNNASESNGGTGVRFGDVGNGLAQGNIAADNANSGFFFRQGATNGNPVVKNNLSVGSGSYGFFLDDNNLSNVRFDNNYAVDSADDGIRFDEAGGNVASFTRNNTVRNDAAGSLCGIFNNTGGAIVQNKHYFGGGDVVCDNPVTGTAANKPNPVNVRKAAGL